MATRSISANSLEAQLQPLLDEAVAGYIANLDLPWDVHATAALAAADGTMVAGSDATTAATTRRIVAAMRAFFGAAWRRGDAAVLNDPDSGSVHPTQISTVVPVWLGPNPDAAPDYWALVRADIPDFGGWELGGHSPQAFDRWAEGGRVVPVKVRLAGAARREATDTLILNSRTPAITLASVTGMADAATALAERFAGLGDFLGSLDAHHEQAGEADAAIINAALAALAPGQHQGQAEVDVFWDDQDGGTVALTIDRVSNGLRVRFRNPPAIDPRPINCTAGMTEDLVLGAVASALDLNGLHSDALGQALAIELPEGSRLAASVPTAVGIGRQTTGQAVFRAVLDALANGGIAVDADAAWLAYRERRIGDILDPTTGKITTAHAAAVVAEEAGRTESAA